MRTARKAPEATFLPPRTPPVVVHTRTPDQIRADLAAAGVSAAEIEELLALAEAEPPEEVVAEAPAKDPEPAIPDAPPAMVELLKMMSSNEGMPRRDPSRRNERTRIPTLPEPAPPK